MKLVIASNNVHKVAEIKAILAPYFDEILSLRDAGITIDVVEDGDTFEGRTLFSFFDNLKDRPKAVFSSLFKAIQGLSLRVSSANRGTSTPRGVLPVSTKLSLSSIVTSAAGQSAVNSSTVPITS